jgi:hypothetical protein
MADPTFEPNQSPLQFTVRPAGSVQFLKHWEGVKVILKPIKTHGQWCYAALKPKTQNNTTMVVR